MTIHNQWKGGITNLVLPPLPPYLAGISGCQWFKATFDPVVGEEAYLLILDTDSGWDETLAEKRRLFRRPKPLRLFALTGAVETSVGWVGFILWQLFRGEQRMGWWEQYMNPFNPDTISLLRGIGEQTHLKTVMLASDSGRTRDFIEYDDTFELGPYGEYLANIASENAPCDFDLAQKAFMAEVSTERLLQRPLQQPRP